MFFSFILNLFFRVDVKMDFFGKSKKGLGAISSIVLTLECIICADLLEDPCRCFLDFLSNIE